MITIRHGVTSYHEVKRRKLRHTIYYVPILYYIMSSSFGRGGDYDVMNAPNALTHAHMLQNCLIYNTKISFKIQLVWKGRYAQMKPFY